MTQWGFYFDQTRCTGCFTCLTACKDWYDVPAGSMSYMKVHTMEEGRFPDVFVAYLASFCHHCRYPPCVDICPADAVVKRADNGIVEVIKDQCIGGEKCGKLCLAACPWDAPQFAPIENAKMEKCDLCAARIDQNQQPVCVEACPVYALDAGPLDELKKKYGPGKKAYGFLSRDKIKPSIVFKAKDR